jgi:hypothetical protein
MVYDDLISMYSYIQILQKHDVSCSVVVVNNLHYKDRLKSTLKTLFTDNLFNNTWPVPADWDFRRFVLSNSTKTRKVLKYSAKYILVQKVT